MSSDSARTYGLVTLCIHAGQEPDPIHGAVMTPIVLSSTFAQNGPAELKYPGYDYSRAGNPTRTALEGCFAALEGAKHGVAFASGCSATMALLLMLKSGDHVLVGDDVYGGTFRIFDKVMKQFGIDATFLDMSDAASVKKALRPSTKLVWMETPSNPMLPLRFGVAVIVIGCPSRRRSHASSRVALRRKASRQAARVSISPSWGRRCSTGRAPRSTRL